MGLDNNTRYCCYNPFVKNRYFFEYENNLMSFISTVTVFIAYILVESLIRYIL